MQTLTYLALNPFDQYQYVDHNFEIFKIDFAHPLTFNGKPQPKCIDSFCILNQVLKPGPSTYLPLCFYPCLFLCLFYLIAVLFVDCYVFVLYRLNEELRVTLKRVCEQRQLSKGKWYSSINDLLVLLYLHCGLLH